MVLWRLYDAQLSFGAGHLDNGILVVDTGIVLLVGILAGNGSVNPGPQRALGAEYLQFLQVLWDVSARFTVENLITWES